MALQKIKFQINVPLELSLKFTEGKLCDSQFGDPQYMFTTTDERCFFVAEKVAQKIHGLRLKPGEPFDICKAEVDWGNGRRGIEWQVSASVSRPRGEQSDGTLAVDAGAGAERPPRFRPLPKQQPRTTAMVARRTATGTSNGERPRARRRRAHVLMPWALFLLNQYASAVDRRRERALAAVYAGEKSTATCSRPKTCAH